MRSENKGSSQPVNFRPDGGAPDNYLSVIINSLEDELIVVDRDYRIIAANDAMLLRRRKDRPEVIGGDYYDIAHGPPELCRSGHHECPTNQVWEIGKPGRATHAHIYDIGGEKQQRYVDIIASPIIDSQGNITAVTELMRDVTEAKETELRMARAHQDLVTLNTIAIENARLHQEVQHKEEIRSELLREIFSIQEEERRRIARELHDETSQVLASLAVNLEVAAGQLPTGADQSKVTLKKAQDLSLSILEGIHKLIYELRPILLDDLGLVAAIRWLVDNNLAAAGIKASFKTSGTETRLSPQLEATVFRVVQEAVTNIIKHAQAKKAGIILLFKRSSFRVHIRDDGRGFNVDEAISSKDRPRGLGLLGMKERIELINGSLTIHSHPGTGSEVSIEIPLSQEVTSG